VCLLSPFGAQVHAPWAMAIERRLTTAGYDPEVMWADDGIVLRLPDTDRHVRDPRGVAGSTTTATGMPWPPGPSTTPR
jgi:ATP-dependent helicase Lhr and Lhr-like helicase